MLRSPFCKTISGREAYLASHVLACWTQRLQALLCTPHHINITSLYKTPLLNIKFHMAYLILPPSLPPPLSLPPEFAKPLSQNNHLPPQPTNRLHAPLNHSLNPRPQRIIRTLDTQILEPNTRNKTIKFDLNPWHGNAQVVQALELGFVVRADVCGVFGGVVCDTIGGAFGGAVRGGVCRVCGRGARVWNRADGGFAELGFEEKKETGEAGCWVGGGVGVVFLWGGFVGVGVWV